MNNFCGLESSISMEGTDPRLGNGKDKKNSDLTSTSTKVFKQTGSSEATFEDLKHSSPLGSDSLINEKNAERHLYVDQRIPQERPLHEVWHLMVINLNIESILSRSSHFFRTNT